MESAVAYPAEQGAAAGGAVADAPADKKVEENDNLGTLIQWVEDYEEATTDGRAKAERDRDYYDGIQLTTEEINTLKARGQSDSINNEIQRKVDFLTGFEATQRTDPKGFPRTPADEEASEAATDMLRFQEQSSDLDQLFSDVWEFMMIEGFGGVEVLGPKKSNPNVIEVIGWPWDRLFYDPHSRAPDFSDARYKGGVMWMDSEEACALWSDKEAIIKSTVDSEPVNSETLDDRPAHVKWAMRGKRDRVRIVQIDYKVGDKIHRCTFCKGGKLKSEEIEFLDENDEPDDPMILQSAYVDRKNNRYGTVRQFIGPQDEINKRSSKSLHLLTVKGGMYEEGAIDDIKKWKDERAKPDGMAKANPGGLDRIKLDDKVGDVSGNLQLLQEAKQAIQLKGPNSALQGKQGGDASGKAIRASQEGGIIEMARVRDRHKHFKLRVYRAIWNRCRQFLDAETWIRVTDNEKNVKFVGFNRPLTFAEAASKELEAKGVPPEEIAQAVPALAAELGLPSPEIEIGKTNVLADMDMDIIIENATEAINVQEEQFEGLVQLASAGVTFPPAVYIKASSLRNKDELIEMLPKPDEATAQLDTAQKAADVDKTVSETLKNQATAAKALADAEATKTQTAIAPAMAAIPENTIAPAMPGETGGDPMVQGALDPAAAAAEQFAPAPLENIVDGPPMDTGQPAELPGTGVLI